MYLLNSDELGRVIKILDDLLISGLSQQRSLFTDYSKRSAEEGFNLEEYSKTGGQSLEVWSREVLEVLDVYLPQHYTFHFLNPRVPASLHIVGFPENISRMRIRFEYLLYALEDIILRLEERENLSVRKEIAEKELQTDTLYQIAYSEHTREIKLNGIVLARPNEDSKATNFFEYIYSHPNEPTEMTKIEEVTALKLSENVHDILRDLGFTGSIRKVFFPVATKTKVMFMNPISKQYSLKNDLPVIDLTKQRDETRSSEN